MLSSSPDRRRHLRSSGRSYGTPRLEPDRGPTQTLGPGGVLAALAQEPLELAGDRSPEGSAPGSIAGSLSGGLLEPLDERLHVGVALDRER